MSNLTIFQKNNFNFGFKLPPTLSKVLVARLLRMAQGKPVLTSSQCKLMARKRPISTSLNYTVVARLPESLCDINKV